MEEAPPARATENEKAVRNNSPEMSEGGGEQTKEECKHEGEKNRNFFSFFSVKSYR